MMVDIRSPETLTPNESGVTSINRRSWIASDVSPARIPPYTAAPYATASSGLIPLFGSFPSKKSFINY